MELFYIALFLLLVALSVALEWYNSKEAADGEGGSRAPPGFLAFRNNYLLVYSLMMAGDWLQGPYIYALYEHYGYKVGDIGRLFIAGFGSSMVFGTIAGAMADKHGRRKACLMYVVTYSVSCLTKHCSIYWVLLLGRLLGGVSTSLLFSSFESWLVAEHHLRGYPPSLLCDVFAKSVFLGGGLMAILSGLLGNLLVEDLGVGTVAPFDAAVAVMMLGGGVVLASWTENYGTQGLGSLTQQFRLASKAIMSDRKIALLGVMQALFEASMYTFVFLWTPALSPGGEKIPHGMVFSCFMTACMAGSALTGLLMRHMHAERFMVWLFAVSAVSLMVPFIFHLELREVGAGTSLGEAGKGGISVEGKLQLLAFCVFEGCVGIFWPSMMTQRARFVPEEMRSTIINIFRIPLNLFVCLILFEVSSFPLSVMFGLCVVFLFMCVLCQNSLNQLILEMEAPALVGRRRTGGGDGVGPGPVTAVAINADQQEAEVLVETSRSDHPGHHRTAAGTTRKTLD